VKFTLSWLKEHLDTDEPLEKLADKLTMIGLEVENIEDKAKALAPFTIARVISAEQHPNADRLRVCMVDPGNGSAPVQVVCGAPNARAGLISVFSAPGTFIPGKNITLGVGTIRGAGRQHGLRDRRSCRLERRACLQSCAQRHRLHFRARCARATHATCGAAHSGQGAAARFFARRQHEHGSRCEAFSSGERHRRSANLQERQRIAATRGPVRPERTAQAGCDRCSHYHRSNCAVALPQGAAVKTAKRLAARPSPSKASSIL